MSRSQWGTEFSRWLAMQDVGDGPPLQCPGEEEPDECSVAVAIRALRESAEEAAERCA